MSLAEIVVDQLVFILGASDEVLDQDIAVDLLESSVSSLAGLPRDDLASVRQVAQTRYSGQPEDPKQDVLHELVLLLDEIEAEIG